MEKKILAICGASGTGKDFITDVFSKRCDAEGASLVEPVVATTRPRRLNERNNRRCLNRLDYEAQVESGEVVLDHIPNKMTGYRYGFVDDTLFNTNADEICVTQVHHSIVGEFTEHVARFGVSVVVFGLYADLHTISANVVTDINSRSSEPVSHQASRIVASNTENDAINQLYEEGKLVELINVSHDTRGEAVEALIERMIGEI